MQRRYRMTVLVMLLLGISMGYALLTSNLNILGVAGILNPTWDIHFENVQVKSGSVTAPTPTIDTNKTTVSYSVTLNTPGDFYEFTVDAVNAGTIDGMITEISSTLNNVEIDNNLPPALEYSITYDDGVELAQNQILSAGDSETYKVRVGYKTDIDPEDLPSTEQTLNLTLTVTYQQADDNSEEINHRSLYSVLKKEATSNGLAKEYTGSHHDSFTEEPSKKIYHWYAKNDTEGTQVLEKNNVIFADHCWQMIRTTDTGGVKMIYNGEVENSQCLNTRSKHIGFKNMSVEELASSYWYGSDYTFNNNTNMFYLSGTTEQAIWSDSTYQGLIGKYTCKSNTNNGTCDTIYYIESYNDSNNANVIQIYFHSNYSEIGYGSFSDIKNPIGSLHVGYMYDKAYSNNSFKNAEEGMNERLSISTPLWYSDSISYNSATEKYSLTNPIRSTSYTSDMIGKYILPYYQVGDHTNKEVYYVTGSLSQTKYYYIKITGGFNINDYNYIYTYGDSYIDNGNGTYTINNPQLLQRIDWLTYYESLKNKYICKNVINNICNELWYVTDIYENRFFYIDVSNVYKYANSFTYDGTKYILDGINYSIWNFSDENNLAKINNAHYTCFNSSGECEEVSYIFNGDMYPQSGAVLKYINLIDGNSIEEFINELLYDENINKNSSAIKKIVEYWYKNNLYNNYDSYIEDTVFCNKRDIESFGSWNPNGTISGTNSYLRFKDSGLINDLSCTNITDKFSTENNKAKLSYKTGLMTTSEATISNNANTIKTGRAYHLFSPCAINGNGIQGCIVGVNGKITNDFGLSGVRPVISLVSGSYYTTGDGSMANPYIVNTSGN